MVTGIECAGLVLAVLPMLIAGIQAYSTSMSTITRARKYRSTLRQYSLDLSREHTVFRNTWFRIVQLVDYNSGGHLRIAPGLNLQVLRENPQAAVVGHNIDLKTILSIALQGFDDAGLNDIERTFEELSDLITRVANDFKIPATAGVRGHSMTFPGPVNCNLTSGSTQAGSKGYKARLKNLQKMLETELGEEYRSEKLSQIREKNIFLSRLITGDTVAQTFAFTRDQGQPRTPINTRRGLGHTKLYNHIQRQAKSLHRALQQKFEPSTARCCGLGHWGLLQLEVRGISKNKQPMPMNLNHVCYRFGLCFSFEASTTGLGEVDSACELELEIITDPSGKNEFGPSCDSTLQTNGRGTEEGKSQGKGKEVYVKACRNIIVCIPQIVEPHPGSKNLHEQPPAALIASLGLCQSCAIPNVEVISSLCGAATAAVQGEGRRCVGILSNIGDVNVRVCPRGGKQLGVKPMELVTLQTLFSQPQQPSVRERLKLAVLLASSVMQLHETSWLNKLWYSSDIFFKGADAQDFRLAEPYLKSTFQTAQASGVDVVQKEDEWSDSMLCCNQTLFMLGIILIEVYHWKPFEALENGRRRSKAVRETVAELFQNAGENYGLSVKTCVQGLPCMEMDLHHEGFKNEVYEKIVAPLEDNLKHFCGTEDLSTIFNSSTNS